LRQVYEDYRHIERQCAELLAEAEKLADLHYRQQIELLETLPGGKKLSAVIIGAELGGNISLFPSAAHLTGWWGLRPKNDESAGKIKSRSITKSNKYLRRILVQTAWAASRKKDCFFQTKFEQLTIRKGSKKALIAIARKQLVVVWNMVSKNEVYQERKTLLSQEQMDRKKKYYEQKLRQLTPEKVG
ncbi:MAG: transposase, partial [Bacteroidota bacterium]